jgi:hypothetical protein
VSKALRNQPGIAVQIEHFTNALFYLRHQAGIVRRDPNFQPVRAGNCLNMDKSNRVFDAKQALEIIFGDSLDARNRM